MPRNKRLSEIIVACNFELLCLCYGLLVKQSSMSCIFRLFVVFRRFFSLSRRVLFFALLWSCVFPHFCTCYWLCFDGVSFWMDHFFRYLFFASFHALPSKPVFLTISIYLSDDFFTRTCAHLITYWDGAEKEREREHTYIHNLWLADLFHVND